MEVNANKEEYVSKLANKIIYKAENDFINEAYECVFEGASNELCKYTDKDVNGFNSVTHQNKKHFRYYQVLVSESKNAIESWGNKYALLENNKFSEEKKKFVPQDVDHAIKLRIEEETIRKEKEWEQMKSRLEAKKAANMENRKNEKNR